METICPKCLLKPPSWIELSFDLYKDWVFWYDGEPDGSMGAIMITAMLPDRLLSWPVAWRKGLSPTVWTMAPPKIHMIHDEDCMDADDKMKAARMLFFPSEMIGKYHVCCRGAETFHDAVKRGSIPKNALDAFWMVIGRAADEGIGVLELIRNELHRLDHDEFRELNGGSGHDEKENTDQATSAAGHIPPASRPRPKTALEAWRGSFVSGHKSCWLRLKNADGLPERFFKGEYCEAIMDCQEPPDCVGEYLPILLPGESADSVNPDWIWLSADRFEPVDEIDYDAPPAK